MASLENITISTTPKRPWDETLLDEEHQEETKRFKSYNQILSLLDEEEEDPTQDLSSLITSLQEELFCPVPAVGDAADEENDGEGERVMRHLLEASDDELGLPNRGEAEEEAVVVGGSGSSNIGSGSSEFEVEVEEEVFVNYDHVFEELWELEDVGFSNSFFHPEMFI